MRVGERLVDEDVGKYGRVQPKYVKMLRMDSCGVRSLFEFEMG